MHLINKNVNGFCAGRISNNFSYKTWRKFAYNEWLSVSVNVIIGKKMLIIIINDWKWSRLKNIDFEVKKMICLFTIN